MRAINHAMTGAIIGLSITAPIALPLAFVSHFAMDAVPHHDNPNLSRKKFTQFLALDICLCIALVIVLFIIQPKYWFLAILCAALATSPDIMWFKPFITHASSKPKPLHKRSILVRFHTKVQWYQEPIGIISEIIWGIITFVVLFYLLRS